MTDRRDFLLSLSATAALGLGASAPGWAACRHAADGSATARFAAQLNRRFRFSGMHGERSAHAQLVAVTDLSRDHRLEQFALRFRAPPGAELDEGLYVMTAPSGSRSEQFVQPLAGKGADREFTIHFSLLT